MTWWGRCSQALGLVAGGWGKDATRRRPQGSGQGRRGAQGQGCCRQESRSLLLPVSGLQTGAGGHRALARGLRCVLLCPAASAGPVLSCSVALSLSDELPVARGKVRPQVVAWLLVSWWQGLAGAGRKNPQVQIPHPGFPGGALGDSLGVYCCPFPVALRRAQVGPGRGLGVFA